MSESPRRRLRKADFVEDEAQEAGDDEVDDEERHADQEIQLTDLELEQANAFEERVKANMCPNWKQRYPSEPAYKCTNPLKENDFSFDTYVNEYNSTTNEWKSYDGHVCWYCRDSRDKREQTQMRKYERRMDKQAQKDVQSCLRIEQYKAKTKAAKAVSDRNRAQGMAVAKELQALGIPVPGVASRSPSPRGSPRIKASPSPRIATPPPSQTIREEPPPPSPTASISPPTERFAALATNSPPATVAAIHVTPDMCHDGLITVTPPPVKRGPRVKGKRLLQRGEQVAEEGSGDIEQVLDAALKEAEAAKAQEGDVVASGGDKEEGEITDDPDMPSLLPAGD